ncbi:MAG: FAD-binding protein, partial [Sphingobacteriales bacterium]
MIKNIQLTLLPGEADQDVSIRRYIALETGYAAKRIRGFHIDKRSIDARSRQPKIILQLTVYIDQDIEEPVAFDPGLRDVSNAPVAVIIGAGPAGLFAALRFITLGYRPLLVERGKDVRSRRRDLAAMNREGIVNPDSNYCFGEGGAGT